MQAKNKSAVGIINFEILVQKPDPKPESRSGNRHNPGTRIWKMAIQCIPTAGTPAPSLLGDVIYAVFPHSACK